ncbi:MAG: GNAT family N-acetyltransferase [Chromatiales bacterium]|nr:GNAT family N-acetyltransferase [Chromatiales bacterium]
MEVKAVHGREIAVYLPQIAALRIEVFHAFPYLYQGSLDYEQRYLQTYVDSPDSVCVLVFDGSRIVGASTAVPLSDEMAEVQAPFTARGKPLAKFFYLGESVLQSGYRGQGLGVRFFQKGKPMPGYWGGSSSPPFCAVIRPDNHPRRPPDYQPLDRFWEKRGYRKQPDLVGAFSWRDLDDLEETAKPMQFWLKRL